MPTLDQHAATATIKMLLIGNSGSGKTGALASLADAGFNLHILDFDAGLDFLAGVCKHPERIRYETLTDKMKATPNGPIVLGQPQAFSKAMKLLDEWVPTLGANDVLVIDSMTFMGKAVYRYAQFLNPGVKDNRQTYFDAQTRVEGVLSMLFSDAVGCHVIVSSHITYIEVAKDINKGYPAAIGRALSPQIPRYFNTCLLAEVVGVGPGAKRMLQTAPTGLIDVKHIIPHGLPKSLPIEDGLATFFAAAKNRGAKKGPA